jgi:hypothetical protein
MDCDSDSDSEGLTSLFRPRDPATEVFYFRGITLYHKQNVYAGDNGSCDVQFHFNFANEVWYNSLIIE